MRSIESDKHPQSVDKAPSQLLKQLGSRETSVRIQALESLAKGNHPGILDVLVKALSDRNPMVRVTAVEKLGDLKAAEAIPHLIEKLSDPNYEVRMRTAESLGFLLQGEKSPRALIKLLKDPDELVRLTAAEALGIIRDQKALPQLRAATDDPSPLVRRYAAEALGKIGNKRDIVKLEKQLKKETSESAKVGFCQALYMLGRHQFLQDLLCLLQSRDYQVRCATANTLSALHPKRAETPMILSALRKAIRHESTVAARSSMRATLRAMNKAGKG